MKDRYIVAIVTFALFSAEAYSHYLVAKNEGQDEFKFYVPSFNTSVKNLGILAVFSYLNGVAVQEVKKLL